MSSNALRFHVATGNLGKVVCRAGFLLMTNSVRPDFSKPCPACNKTERARRVMGTALMNFMCAPQPPKPLPEPAAPTLPQRVYAAPEPIDTTGYRVVSIPEGVRPRTNRDGKTIRKGGQVVMETLDFRSDAAVTHRMVRSGSRWGRGNVTGSTSTSTNWAVPARPYRDDMASSSDVLKDLRSAETERDRQGQKKTPRRGKRAHSQSRVVRRYTI